MIGRADTLSLRLISNPILWSFTRSNNNNRVNRTYTSEIREINGETGNGAVAFLHDGPDGLRQARAIGFPRGYLTAA